MRCVVWLKLLHIATVIVWAGTLLYLLVVLAHAHAEPHPGGRRLPRQLFTHAATPLALIAITSGSALFLLQGPLALWLLAKLMLVSLLVLVHGAAGLLVLRGERQLEASGTALRQVGQHRASQVALWTGVGLLGGIATLVLLQPAW